MVTLPVPPSMDASFAASSCRLSLGSSSQRGYGGMAIE